MLRSNRGPLVMEVNSSPGIQGMEQVTSADLAGAMLDFLERNAGCRGTRTRGMG
jgi:ribosomal protein S6--L-glutamate ligase